MKIKDLIANRFGRSYHGPNAEAMKSRLSTLEGQYEILGRIHEGGMGAIYKVRHRLLDQVRVVKVMHPQMEGDASHRERFIREARTAVRLRHPNIGHLFDFKIDGDGTAYIVMELIAGRNLHELQALLGPLDVGVVAQLASQGLAAIGYLHKGNLVHRDISPDNLLVTVGSDGEPRVKLIDFGIAKSLDSRIALTEAGVFIGKVVYASPEHFGGLRGEATVEPRSDLYSLAVVLYEALTGVSPIAGNDTAAIISSHLFSAPRAFSESDPRGKVPEAVRDVILTALEKDPNSRYRDAESFGLALRQAAEREIEASRKPGGPWARLRATLEAIEGRPEAARPGSTQDRLDVLFPPSGEVALKEQLEHVEHREDKDELAAQLLAEARRLLADGQPDQALTRVRQVLALGSKRTEALQIRAEIEKAHADLMAKLRAMHGAPSAAQVHPPAVEPVRPAVEPPVRQPSGEAAGAPEPASSELLARFDEALMEDYLGDAERYLWQLEGAYGREHEEVASRSRQLKAVVDKRQAATLARDSLDRLGSLVDAGRYQEAEAGLADAMSQQGRAEDRPTADWIAIEERIRAGREALLAAARGQLEAGDLPATELAIQQARQQGAPLGSILSLERDLELASSGPPSLEKQRAPAWLWAAGVLALVAAGVGIMLSLQPPEAIKSAVEPASESSVEPASESSVEPASESSVEPASESLVEPTLEREIVATATGMLRLDALPWVELVAIVDAEDQPLSVSADTYTPVALELPPGTYTLTLSHPRLAQPRQLQVAVRSGETVVETLEVEQYSADQYFEASW